MSTIMASCIFEAGIVAGIVADLGGTDFATLLLEKRPSANPFTV